jgi:Putative lumazine-binding
MKKFILLAALTVATQFVSATTQAQTATISEADRRGVAVPLEVYIKAQSLNDGALLMTAFHKDAQLIGADQSGMFTLSAKQYARGFSGKPDADEAQRKRSYEILSVTNDAAIAVVVLDYPKVKYTDYMSLLKVKGDWKIVNKTFFAERR